MSSPCSQHQHVHRLIQQPLTELTEKLRRGARKVTAPRQAILDVLRKHASPLTNKEIHAALGKEDCDLATIYRNMHTLELLGLVRRYDFGDGAARFELSAEEGSSHHHHLVCTRCRLIVEVDECFPEEFQSAIASRHGFTQVQHRLEFTGWCPKCQSR